jgi:hypothetical protein
MDIGAIGGCMAGSGAIALAAPGVTQAVGVGDAGGSAPIGSPPSAGFGGGPGNLASLASTLQGFSSAEILMALMLMNAAKGEKSHGSDGNAAMAFLAGWALGGHGAGAALQSPMPNGGLAPLGMAPGMQLDIQG